MAPTGIWVLRHGESTANVEGLIVSRPGRRALVEVGLTDRGREQAREAGAAAAAAGFDACTRILMSDFARARETAELFAAAIGAPAPRIDQRLRERGFGDYDEGPTSAYDEVWAADAAHEDPGHGVEPVSTVAARVGEVFAEARETTSIDPASPVDLAGPVVLVAHGDVLQIALALGAGMDPHDHRRVPHLGNAELRRLDA